MRKAPILIEAPSLSLKKVQESNTAEKIDTNDEVSNIVF